MIHKNKVFVLFAVFLVCVPVFAQENSKDTPPVVALPVSLEHPKNKARVNIFDKKRKRVPVVSWEIEKQQGVQIVSRLPGTKLFTKKSDHEVVFPTNNYKSVMLTVFFDDLFILHSDLTAGFSKDNTPFVFSMETVPYLYHEWTSAEVNFYVAKRAYLPNNFALYPFVGYIFSQYYLQKMNSPTNLENVRLQTFTTGVKVTFQPNRMITLDYGLTFSPILMLNYNNMLLYQIGYEAAVRIKTSFMLVSAVLSTRNNIEYSSQLLGTDTIRVSEIGVKFKFIL